MDKYIVLPVIIPLLTAILATFAPRRNIRRWVVHSGMAANFLFVLVALGHVLAQDVVLVTQPGGWPAPYGITLAIDALSGLMLAVTGLLALCVAVYADVTIDTTRDRFGFFPIFALMIMGINLAFITGDLFNLYVSFEIMLTASFGLLVLGDREMQIKGGLKYMLINLLSSTVFVIAIAMTYGALGTLNMAHLVQRAQAIETPSILTVISALYLVGFGIKAAIFPFFFWLPASYHTPPVAVTAIFGGILTKVGIYGMLRVLVFIFPAELGRLQWIWLVLAGATMLVGVFGALNQREIRRVFSFLIISHVGFIMMGISFNTRLGLTAAIFYMVHHMIVKTALFMATGLMENRTQNKDLHEIGDLMRQAPALAGIFFVGALSLAGIPPLSGFFAKFALVSAAWSAEQYWLGAISLVVSLITIIAVMRVWQEGYWKVARPLDERQNTLPGIEALSPGQWRLSLAAVGLLVSISVGLGVLANPGFWVAERAADAVLNPTRYTNTILQAENLPVDDLPVSEEDSTASWQFGMKGTSE